MVVPVGNALVAVGTAKPVQPCHLGRNFVSGRLTALRATDSWTHGRHRRHGSHRGHRRHNRRPSSRGWKSRRHSEAHAYS